MLLIILVWAVFIVISVVILILLVDRILNLFEKDKEKKLNYGKDDKSDMEKDNSGV